MTAQHETYPTVEYLIDKFADWLKHRRELSEIRRLNRTDFDLIARDLRVSPDDLERLVAAGQHSADEMPKMLKALGIDVAGLARTEPLLVRDMQRVWSLCRDKAHCHGELAEGTAARHYKDYCPNAPTIDALGELARHRPIGALMSRTVWIRAFIALLIALAAPLLIRQHNASGVPLALYGSFPA